MYVEDVECLACGSIDGWRICVSCVLPGGGSTPVAFIQGSGNSYAAVSAGGDNSAKTTVNRADSKAQRRAERCDRAVWMPQSAAKLTKDGTASRPMIRERTPRTGALDGLQSPERAPAAIACRRRRTGAGSL